MITISSLALSRITSIASGGCGTVKAGTLGFKNREEINFSEDKANREGEAGAYKHEYNKSTTTIN